MTATAAPKHAADRGRSRHVVTAPLAHAGRLLGALAVTRLHRRFSDRELDGVLVLAQQAAARLEVFASAGSWSRGTVGSVC